MPLKTCLLILVLASMQYQSTESVPEGGLLGLYARTSHDVYHIIKDLGLRRILIAMIENNWIRRTFFLDGNQLVLHLALYVLLDRERDRALGRKYNKVQREFTKETPFPCNITGGRSKTRPKSADFVRPGDIDVVAQIGDSIIRGNGLAGTNVLQFLSADHDIAMGIGGRETWRQYLTLPNIIKEFNPNLTGYATKNSAYHARSVKSVYDFAFEGMDNADFPIIVRNMVNRMKVDPKVNFDEDWKLVTILAGGVSMCHYYCYFDNISIPIAKNEKHLEFALDYLMKNLPRTIVNLIVVPNFVKLIDSIKGKSQMCKMAHHGICPCLYIINQRSQERYLEALDKIPYTQIKIASQQKYQEKEDFAVLVQPFFINASVPSRNTPNGRETDFRYLATDCLHFSQRTHAIITEEAWNAMLTPSSEKSKQISKILLDDFKCPTEEKPYIITPRNEKLIQ